MSYRHPAVVPNNGGLTPHLLAGPLDHPTGTAAVAAVGDNVGGSPRSPSANGDATFGNFTTGGRPSPQPHRTSASAHLAASGWTASSVIPAGTVVPLQDPAIVVAAAAAASAAAAAAAGTSTGTSGSAPTPSPGPFSPSPPPAPISAPAAVSSLAVSTRGRKRTSTAFSSTSTSSVATFSTVSDGTPVTAGFVTEADMELAVVSKLRQERIGEVESAAPVIATARGNGVGNGGGGEPVYSSSSTASSTMGNLETNSNDDLVGEEEYVDEIYDIVDSVVPRTDDPTLPALTFRVWVISIIFGFLLSLVNTIFSFRTNNITVNPLIVVLLAYPMGATMASVLPRQSFLFGLSLNPGPFNLKEHALIYVFASACTTPAYALYNIVGQRFVLYQESLTLAACVFFSICTQCFGYGLAGLCRRFLVRPAAMLWPSNLSTIALLNSLHSITPAIRKSLADVRKYREEIATYTSRFRFFWLALLCTFAWQWVPGYFAPVTSAISILCYLAPLSSRPDVMRVLGSGTYGQGMLSITLDWSLITLFSPITTPLWALLNQFMGLWFFAWVVTPALWARSAFGKDFELGTQPRDGANGSGTFPIGHAMNTGMLLNRDGAYISTRSLVNLETLSLNTTAYDANAPIYISTWFAVIYVASFITFVSCLVHVWIWYGRDIMHRLQTTIHDLDTRDVHAQMMDVYPEVPDLWYFALLLLTLVTGIAVCQWGGFQLPWWAVLLGLLFALVSMIPIGTIQAISGQQIGLNVMSEFLIGVILPGNISGVMAFKTFSYMAMYQGLLLVSDLKLGHYLKIPPRAMFAVQLAATVLAAVVNVFAAFYIYQAFGRTDDLSDPTDPNSPLVWRLQSSDPPVGWSANQYTVFISAGGIWGAIGPARFFGLDSPYSSLLAGFLAGAALPFVPYLLHRAFPRGYWHLVNIPVLSDIVLNPGESLSVLTTPLLVGIAVNYFAKKYRPGWWKRYAFVLAAALDSGTAVALTVIFLAFTIRDQSASKGPRTLFPFYALNRFDPELCTPAFYETCQENAVLGGGSYNLSEDPYCSSIGYGLAK